MQLLPSLAADAKAAAREAPAGRHLPFARHVDAHTVETRDGLLMQVIALRGLLFETADTDEINYRKRLRDAMLQAIGDPRFAFLHHLIRRPIQARLEADYGDRFSRQLDEMWSQRLAGRKLFANDLYLTIIRRPLEGRVGMLGSLRDAIFGSNRAGPSGCAGDKAGHRNAGAVLSVAE